MAILPIQDITEAGVDAVYAAAAAGGDTVKNDGRLLLHVKNGGVGSINVTVAAQKTSAVLAGFGTVSKASVVVAVPNGEDRFIGPYPASAFNDPTGNIAITYSLETSVTVATLRLPAAS